MRIFIPGFSFATFLMLFVWAYPGRYLPFSFDDTTIVLLFFFTALVAGLTLYAKETPKRRKAFSENQPSAFIAGRARTMKDLPLVDETEARRLYFYLLNNHIPSAFHEKIFFFGTIYHIMIQVRRTSFWFAVVSALAVGLELSLGAELAELQRLLLFSIVSWLVYLLNVRYNKADRKMQENYQDQIFWLEMNSDLVDSLLRRRQGRTTRR
ncbi:MAG: hypothetical protein WD295_01640 [Bacteroidota bacterium]